MSYPKMAKDILNAVGGNKNIVQITHCATRLRFNLKDESLAREKEIEKIKGVKGIAKAAGQFQIIIGTEVPYVAKEVEILLGGNVNSDTSGSTKKEGIFNRILSILAGSITPMIPALTGAGLLKAFMALFVTLKWMDKTSDVYVIMNFIADAAFYFMPIMVAYGAAQKFKCNSVLAMVVAGTLLHPNFSQLVTTGDPVSFFGIPLQLVSYGSTILPAILATWLMSYVEKIAEKVIPNFIKYFLKPLAVIAITSLLTILFIAPLGNLVGNIIATGIDSLNTLGSWFVPTVVGGVFPLLILTGMHWSLAPFWLGQIANNGYETLLGPGSLASNIAQGAASLAVALKTKNKEQKQIASSAGFTALMGITEPAMFGVTIKQKGILFSVMAGGMVGGLFAGLSGLVRYSAGGEGIALLPVFIGENPMNIVYALITMVIAFVVTFTLTYFIGFNASADEASDDEKEIVSNERISLASPMEGQIVDLAKVNDEMFSKKMMGDGIAIIPSDGKVYSPSDGEVTVLFDTLHAIGMKTNSGVELLIHIGIDTVNLNGKFFKAFIKNGEKVKKNQLLIEFDMEKIKNEDFDIITPIIITNSADYKEITRNKNGKVKVNDPILTLMN